MGGVKYQIQPKPNTYFRLRPAVSDSFRPHLHSFYELLWSEAGELFVTVSGKELVLHSGEAALIFPYQVHSYPEQSGSVWHLCTFAPEMIGSFAVQYAEFLPQNNVFRFSYDVSKITNESSIFAKKAFLYTMCNAVVEQVTFVPAPMEGRQLLEKMFVQVEKHFSNPEFTLRNLAQMLTYDYGYLSKIFIERTGMKFNYYLNLRRITYAADLLARAQCESVEDAAYSCGYSNVRTFNRNFKAIHGVTPVEYLQRLSK